MDIQQINKEDPESIRIAFKNVSGATVTTGYGVALVTSAASFDGVGAAKSTAALMKEFLGVAASNVPNNSFGKAIAYGYAASIALSNAGTSITVTAGDVLKPGAVAGTFFSSVTDAAMTTLMYRYILNGQTQTISAAAWVEGFVKGF